MKLKYIFASIISLALLAVGCTKEDPASLNNISVSKTYLSIPEEGGSVEVTVNALEEWKFELQYKSDDDLKDADRGCPTWLTASAEKGVPGETVITFSAEKTEAGREAELHILVGTNTQILIVRQGEMTVSDASCAEVIAGPDGKSFRVTGTCTSIYNTTYGNWYLNDGTGEITIYGTLDKDGAEKNFPSLGIEVGDVVTVEGPKATYGSTIELVKVTVVKISKALLKLVSDNDITIEKDADTLDVKLAFKGNGAYFEIDQAKTTAEVDYLTTKIIPGVPSKLEKNPADTAIFTFAVAKNSSFDLKAGSIKFWSGSTEATFNFTQKSNLPEKVTIKQAIADRAKGSQVYVEGVIKAICGKGYILDDGTEALLIYLPTIESYAVGDKMKIAGKVAVFNFGAQIQSPLYEVKDGTEEFQYPEAIVYDATKVKALKDELSPKVADKASYVTPVEYIQLSGKVNVSGNYYNLILDGTTEMEGSFYQLSDEQKTQIGALHGKNVRLNGYKQSVSISKNAPKYLNVIYTSVEEIK